MDTFLIFRDGYSTDVWDSGSNDTSRESAQEDTATYTRYRIVVTQEGMSGTHGLRGDPSAMILHEHSKFQVTE